MINKNNRKQFWLEEILILQDKFILLKIKRKVLRTKLKKLNNSKLNK